MKRLYLLVILSFITTLVLAQLKIQVTEFGKPITFAENEYLVSGDTGIEITLCNYPKAGSALPFSYAQITFIERYPEDIGTQQTLSSYKTRRVVEKIMPSLDGSKIIFKINPTGKQFAQHHDFKVVLHLNSDDIKNVQKLPGYIDKYVFYIK